MHTKAKVCFEKAKLIKQQDMCKVLLLPQSKCSMTGFMPATKLILANTPLAVRILAIACSHVGSWLFDTASTPHKGNFRHDINGCVWQYLLLGQSLQGSLQLHLLLAQPFQPCLSLQPAALTSALHQQHFYSSTPAAGLQHHHFSSTLTGAIPLQPDNTMLFSMFAWNRMCTWVQTLSHARIHSCRLVHADI